MGIYTDASGVSVEVLSDKIYFFRKKIVAISHEGGEPNYCLMSIRSINKWIGICGRDKKDEAKIIPSEKKIIDRHITSVLSKTTGDFQDWEIIVYEDGSWKMEQYFKFKEVPVNKFDPPDDYKVTNT